MGRNLFSKLKKASSSRQKSNSASMKSSQETLEFLKRIERENELLLGATVAMSSDDMKKEQARIDMVAEKDTIPSITAKDGMEYSKEEEEEEYSKEDMSLSPRSDSETSMDDRMSADGLAWHKFGFNFGSYPSVYDQPYFESFVNHVDSLGISKFSNSQKNLITRMLQGQSFQVTSACGSGKSFALIGTFVGCMAKDATLVWVYDRKGNHILLRHQMAELISSMSGGQLTVENGSVVDFGSVDDLRVFEQGGVAFPRIALTPCAKLADVLGCLEGHVVVAFDECQTIFNEAEEFELAEEEECMMHTVLAAFQDFTRRRRRPSFQVICISAVGDLVEKKILGKKKTLSEKAQVAKGKGFRSVSTVVSEFFGGFGIVKKIDGESMPVINVNDDHREWLETFVVHLLDHEAIYEQSLHIAMKLLSPGRNIFVVRDGGQLKFFLDFIRKRGLTVTSNWDKWSDPNYRIILVRDTEVCMLQGQNIHDLTGVYVFTLPPEKDLHLSFQAIGRVGRLSQIGTYTRALVFMDKSNSRQQERERAAQAILDRYLKEEYHARVVKLQTHRDHKELDLTGFGFSVVDFPIVPVVEETGPDLGNRLYLCPNPFSRNLLMNGEVPRCRCPREHPCDPSLIKWIGSPPRAYLDESKYLATAPEPAFNVYNTMPSLCIQCAFGQCCDGLSSRLIHFGNAKFNEVSEAYLRKFVENNVCEYGFFGDHVCTMDQCNRVHKGDDRLTQRVLDLCIRYFVMKGVCAHSYYWKECDCDSSIQPHIGYDDPRLDMAIGDRTDTLRERFMDYLARRYICTYGCYDRSRCTSEECNRQHCGDPLLLHEGTARAFRRVYLEKYGARMKACRIANVHDSLYCQYFHIPEDNTKRGTLSVSSRASSSSSVVSSTSSSSSSSTKNDMNEIEISAAGSREVIEVDGEAEAEPVAVAVVDRTSARGLVFGSFLPVFDNDEDEVKRDDNLSVHSHPSPVIDMKPLCAPSSFSWSKPTTTATTFSRSLNDIMQEEEEVKVKVEEKKKQLEAEHHATTNTPVTSNNKTRQVWDDSYRPAQGDDDGGEWRSVKKKTNKSEGTTGPKDKKLMCNDCHYPFLHTVGDQKFFARMNFSTLPNSCLACRDKKKRARAEKSRAGKSHG